MSSLLFHSAFAFDAVGLFHSSAAFVTKRQIFFRVAIVSNTIAFALHTLFLVFLGLEEGHFPMANLRESLIFFAWAVSLCLQISFWRYGTQILALFSLPFVAFLMIGTAFLKSYPAPEILRSSWVYWHTTCLILAYGMFFATFVTSLLYLFQQKEIKRRRLESFHRRLPSLLVMDDAFQKFLIWGFFFMTAGLLAGVVWAEEQWANWQSDPKVISAFFTWLIYLFLIYVRLSMGWRGKRTAVLSMVGFLSILFTFLGARVLFGGLHQF